MNSIDEIFKRADIRQIREFLLYGTEELNTDRRTCKERLESMQKRMTVRLREKYTDTEEYGEITELLFEYIGTVEAVYMEIGLQDGTILTAQIVQNRAIFIKLFLSR